MGLSELPDLGWVKPQDLTRNFGVCTFQILCRTHKYDPNSAFLATQRIVAGARSLRVTHRFEGEETLPVPQQLTQARRLIVPVELKLPSVVSPELERA